MSSNQAVPKVSLTYEIREVVPPPKFLGNHLLRVEQGIVLYRKRKIRSKREGAGREEIILCTKGKRMQASTEGRES